MTTTLQILSSVDESTVLYDLNDPTGTNSGLYGAITTKLATKLDLGSPTLQSTTVQPQDIDATYSAFSKRATAEVTGKVIVQATSYDNLVLGVGTLANYLTQGCVMRWQEGTRSYLLDILPSDTPALIAGQDLAIYEVGALFMTTIDLHLQRQPYLRGAALTASANKFLNPTMLRDSNADGLPDSWSNLNGATLSIGSTLEALHVVGAATGTGVTQDTGAGTAAPAQVWTASADIKVTSGTVSIFIFWLDSGSGTLSFIKTTATGTAWARVSITGTAPASTDHIRVRIASDGSAATFDVRDAQLEIAASASPFRVAAQTVNLDPATSGFSKMLPVYNPGTAPAPMTIATAFPDSSSSVQAMSFWLGTSDSNVGKGYLSDFLNGPYYAQAEASGNGWTLTAGTDTTLAGAADATASPGSGTTVARVTHATDPTTYNKRITFTRSTLLDSLRGQHRVLARVKPAAAKKYRLQLSWSAGTFTSETNDEFLLDASTNTSNVWALCDLGTIDLPESTSVTMSSLILELYTRMGLGYSASNLDVDYLMLVPQANSAQVVAVEASTSIAVLTQGADLQVPKDLGAGDPTWTAGTALGATMKLNAANQAAGIGSTTTGGYTGIAGGLHTVTFFITENLFIGTYNVEVANLDLNTVVATQQQVNTTAHSASRVPSLVVNDTANIFQPRITVTSYTSGNLSVGGIQVITNKAILQNQQIRTDPGSTGINRYAAERLDSSSFYVGSLSADRVPFWIPPGLSLLWLESYDVSVGGIELPHINARTLTVTPTVYPRFWG